MKRCVALISCIEGDENIIETREFILELYGVMDICFAIQATQEIWDNLSCKGTTSTIYMGMQKRTVEECLLLCRLNGIVADYLYDSVADELLCFAARAEGVLCNSVINEYESCSSLWAMDANSISKIESSANMTGLITQRANRICFWLQQMHENFQLIAAAENALIGGLVNKNLLDVAYESDLNCWEINRYEILLNDYRKLGRRKGVNEELIADRKSLLIALGMQDFAHDKISLFQFLLVNSAYTFSLSRFYRLTEKNMAGLFIFRSFEFLLKAVALRKGDIFHRADRDGVHFYLSSGAKVTGVGPVWYAVRNDPKIPKSLIDSLSAFVSLRNKSYLGHGFFHLSTGLVENVQREVHHYLSLALSKEEKEYWSAFKRRSRAVRLKDCFEHDLSLVV